MTTSSFDVAFSFASEDLWVARDMQVLLERLGVKSYLSASLPDKASGRLHAELMKLYRESSINVMVLSKTYASKPNDSVVALEKKVLSGRHIRKDDEKSLFILNIDKTALPETFEDITYHSIFDCGITGAVSMVTDRLIKKWHSTTDSISGQPPCHPSGIATNRGPLHPCEFVVSFRYESMRRWRTLGDVLVEIRKGGPLRNDLLDVYLIPSGIAPIYLGHSTLLKARPELLGLKKTLADDFAKSYLGRTFRGHLFYIEKDGMEYPHLYCSEFDAFLIENHEKVPLQ